MNSEKSKRKVAQSVLLVLAIIAFGSASMAQQPEGGGTESIACGDNVSCSRSGWAARISNSGGGGVFLAEQDAYSVAIKGNGRPGVFGSSGAGIGVKGTSTNGAAIWGRSTNDVGVFGRSDNGYGAQFGAASDYDLVLGGIYDDDGVLWSNPSDSDSDIIVRSMDEIHLYLDDDDNDPAEFRVYNGAGALVLQLFENGNMNLGEGLDFVADDSDGEVLATADNSSDLLLRSNTSIYADLDRDNNTSGACFRIRDDDLSTLWQYCDNTGAASAGPSAVMVDTSSGTRQMYSMGSPEQWFEDFGTATLEEGRATVQIEPMFGETINGEAGYKVYLTPVSTEAVLLFVTAKNPDSFEVQGVHLDGSPASATFDYRIVAKRLGYEADRLGMVDWQSPTDLSQDVVPEANPDED